MALLKVQNKDDEPAWRDRDLKRNIRHKIPEPEEGTAINYDFLRSMCDRYQDNPGLPEADVSVERHNYVMKNYHKMFINKNAHKNLSALPSLTDKSKSSKDKKASRLSLMTHATDGTTNTSQEGPQSKPIKENPADVMSHDIRDYVADLHRERILLDPDYVRSENIKTLRKLGRKLPFERTAQDNDKMFHILKTYKDLSDRVPDQVLKELCVIAMIDLWDETEFTVFGNSGLYLILKGSVSLRSRPHLKTDENTKEFRSPTPPPPLKKILLKVGDCFGTLRPLEGRSYNSRALSVLTEEANCEFLRISCSEYKRVIEQMTEKDQTEKVNLLSSCESYKLWPKGPLLKLANIIEWIKFPPNTVLVSEGYKAPFIGVIKSGECHVLREVEVKETLANGKQRVKNQQVVMGKLSERESFGEISLLLEEPITCSIITSTNMELAVMEPERLRELDEVTLQLIKQSSARTFSDFTHDAIHEEYMQQELKREWNEFKHSVVIDVMNSKGVRPGYGKWAK